MSRPVYYAGMKKALNEIYNDAHQVKLASKKFSKKLFDAALKYLYDAKGIKPSDLTAKAVKDFHLETNRLLTKAVDDGIKLSGIKTKMPAATIGLLQKNVFVFSGMKTYHQLKEASLMLLNDEGNIKPFRDFLQDILQIYEQYNVRYLEAEYQFAVSSGNMAARWANYEKDMDKYDLQYRTANDDRVRADHQSLHNITLPGDDPFWDSYMPPNDWGCRCTAVAVNKGKYEVSKSAEAQQLGKKATTKIGADGTNKLAMFRFNPGKQKMIYPGRHPYLARESSPADVKEAQNILKK